MARGAAAHGAAGAISRHEDRIAWIKQELWPAHQELLRTPGGVERELAKDFDEQVKRFQIAR